MSEDVEHECRSIEDALRHADSKGRFQFLLLLSMCVLVLPASFADRMGLFLVLDSPWKCVDNSSYCLSNHTMPRDDKSMCKIPDSEWDYTELNNYSVITQFHLGCADFWILFVIKYMTHIGSLVSCIIIGWFADKYGRRPTLFLCVLGIIIAGVAASFSLNIYVFCVFLFFLGFFLPGAFYLPCVLLVELTTHRYRLLYLNVVQVAISLGTLVLCLKAYFIRQWNLLMIACFAPYIIVIATVLFVPESFLWVHLNCCKNDVKRLLRRIARWDKKVIPSSLSIKPPVNRGVKNESCLMDIFSSSEKTSVQVMAWIIQVVLGVLLEEGVHDVSESIYLNACIVNALDIPAYILTAYSCKLLGRRWTVLVSSVLSGASVIILGFIAKSHPMFMIFACRIGTALFGRFFNTMHSSTLLFWSMELYPTNVRVKAIGIFLTTTTITTPLYGFLGFEIAKLYGGAPCFISGLISFIICGFVMKQMDTTPNTLENGEFE